MKTLSTPISLKSSRTWWTGLLFIAAIHPCHAQDSPSAVRPPSRAAKTLAEIKADLAKLQALYPESTQISGKNRTASYRVVNTVPPAPSAEAEIIRRTTPNRRVTAPARTAPIRVGSPPSRDESSDVYYWTRKLRASNGKEPGRISVAKRQPAAPEKSPAPPKNAAFFKKPASPSAKKSSNPLAKKSSKKPVNPSASKAVAKPVAKSATPPASKSVAKPATAPAAKSAKKSVQPQEPKPAKKTPEPSPKATETRKKFIPPAPAKDATEDAESLSVSTPEEITSDTPQELDVPPVPGQAIYTTTNRGLANNPPEWLVSLFTPRDDPKLVLQFDRLFLSASGVDFAYAAPVDGTTTTSIPIGRVATVDPNHSSGFRLNVGHALDESSGVSASFWRFDSHASHDVSLPGGAGFLRSLTTHRNTTAVDTDSLDATAVYDIDFQIVDVEFSSLIWQEEDSWFSFLFGLRYGHLDEDFAGLYRINGETLVATDIDFDGIGPRIAFDTERRVFEHIFLYGRGAASFLVGNFNADFRQTNVFDGVQAQSGFQDDRIVSILEFEAGIGWKNADGTTRLTAGYFVGAWFNAVGTSSFINAVQTNAFDHVDETLLFDGLAVRLEFRI